MESTASNVQANRLALGFAVAMDATSEAPVTCLSCSGD